MFIHTHGDEVCETRVKPTFERKSKCLHIFLWTFFIKHKCAFVMLYLLLWNSIDLFNKISCYSI